MSFLNPVNEPVLRFSSTDAGAPQINYNARVAGDVKAVLKACLVTGYGAKASAGWSITNEVDHVAEFVSPSAAMSDYRYKIDDTSNTETRWSYIYQGVGMSIGAISNVSKIPSSDITKTSTKNRWELLVTAQGFWFINALFEPRLNGLISHYVYFGRVKSALAPSGNVSNVLFLSSGALSKGSLDGTKGYFNELFVFFEKQAHVVLGDYTANMQLSHAASNTLSAYGIPRGYSILNISDDVRIIGENKNNGLFPSSTHQTGFEIIAQIPGLRIRTVSYDNDLFSVYDEVSDDGRPVIVTRAGRITSAETDFYRRAARGEVLIHTDYWGY